MPVYYDRDNRAYPITRAEQDNWLERGYFLVRHHSKGQFKKGVIQALVISGGIAAIGAYAPWILHQFGSVVAWAALTIIVVLYLCDELTFRRQLSSLRNEIERKLHWRDEIAAPQKRYNSFQTMMLLPLILIVILYVWFSDPSAFGVLGFTVFVGLYGGALMLSKLSMGLDKVQIDRTGKWFRWLRHR